MKEFFRNLPVKYKLNTIILSVCSSILLLTFIIVFVSQWFLYQRNTLEELQSLAKIISNNSTAGLLFEDPHALEKNLRSLAQKSSIIQTTIYSLEGIAIASFKKRSPKGIQQQQLQFENPKLKQSGYLIQDGHISILNPIILDREVIGFLYLQSSMSELYKTLAEAAGYLLVIVVGGIVLGLLLANRLQKIITRPITRLASVISEVSKNRNYLLRVEKESNDELGLLAEGFNNMLEHIQNRDKYLEEQVHDRTAKLQLAMDEAIILADKAQEANKTKSQFLANMSHEIRTPMNGVLGMAEMVLQTELTDEQKNSVDIIKSSGESLLIIINDILDFSKMEAGKLEIENINFNLPALIDDVAQLLAHRAHAKRLELVIDIEDNIHPNVSSDPNRIRQILTNLIFNAIKFTDKGEVHVKVLTISDKDDSTQIRFTVRDTGIGLTDQERDKLFKPFTQADESTTRKYGGTGLGLAISMQLVELLGGEIDCESEYGKGAEFWFDLTLKKASGTRVITGSKSDKLEGLRSLIIDDNATNRKLLAQQMSYWGVEHDSAKNGISGIAKLQKASDDGEPFDMVILDMHMPQMDGLNVAALIRKDKTINGTKIIMLTSVGMRGDANLARDAGINIYLTKPVRQLDLYNSLVALITDDNIEPSKFITRYSMETQLTTFNAKVLLAEDNIINQQVASGVLRKLGCRVDLAMDGHSAVTEASGKAYDIIFMDCQMPTMDGYEATGEIRRLGIKTQNDLNIPIIALTANALSGDREKCIAAGMDDYISKPFQQEKIAAVLKKWLPENLQSSIGEIAGDDKPLNMSKSDQPASDIIDYTVLDAIRKLEDSSSGRILEKIIELFLTDTPQQLEELHKALMEQDVDTVRSISHSLKSSCASLGAIHLPPLLKQLETNARGNSLEGASELLSQIEEGFRKTILPLQSVEGGLGVSTVKTLSGGPLILVVDDDPATRLLIRASLEKGGFRVEEAENGIIAVENFETLKPDAVLLDVMMPELDGFDTCRAIRKLTAGRHTPILMATGLDDINSIHKAFDVGATDFITKPINSAILSYRVKYMLRASDAFHDVIDNQKQIQKLAFFDHLTGLPNRTMFSDTLEVAIAESAENYSQLAVLFMDLDRFKTINDTLGHHAGDILLKSVADRIGSCIRATDLFSLQKQNYPKSYISRQGGDEFTVMLPHLKNPENAGRIARRINESLAQSFQIDVHEVFISASIGISIFPMDGSDAETLMKHADLAMYHAKEKGKNGFQFYKRSLNEKATARFGFENDVRKAVTAEEFTLYYQPQVSLSDGKIIGAEALSRWQHSERGTVPPSEFIPAIEDLGLITPFTDAVIRQACTQKFKWIKAGITPTRIALNISSKHFVQQQIPARIFEVLKRYDLDANFLELELTESVLAEQNAATLAILKELKKMGLTISVDDFGTGYSSLVYLKTFPIDIVKIDRFFIKDILTSPQDSSIVKAIIAMAHSMEMKVIAEGIEDREQYELLKAMGCDFGQGYLFSRPVSPEMLSTMMIKDVSLVEDTI